MVDIDTLRARLPHLGLAVYAYQPLGQITLELHVDGKVYTFEAQTFEDCLRAAGLLDIATEAPAIDQGGSPGSPIPNVFD